MKSVLVSVIAALVAAIGFTVPASAQATYIVGAPGAMDTDTAGIVLNSVVKLLDTGAAGDEVRVYDAWSGQLMGGFTIPNTNSARARRLRTKTEMGVIVSKLERASSVRSGQEGEVRLPHFLQLVSSGLRSGAGDVRVLVFGGPYYTDARDKGFTFGDGLYPSDGHILAPQSKSVFGTAGRQDLLSGCVVHVCYFDDTRFKGNLRSLEISALRRFWHLYISEMGGVLSSFAPSADDVTRRAMTGMKDPVLPDKIDRKDTVIEMRRVGETPKEEVKPEAAPAAAPSSAPHLIILIDGSASMGEALSKSDTMVETAITTGASLCGEVRVAVIVYRGPGETDVLPFTTVRRPQGDGVDEGMGTFRHFLKAKEVRIPDESAPTGFRMVSRMHPRNGLADLGGALQTGLALLRASAAKDAPLLWTVCGDRGPYELGDSSAIEPEERRTAEKLIGELRTLANDYPAMQVLSIYTGDRSAGMGAESASFFEKLAKAAGTRGAFAETPESLLTKALAIFSPPAGG